MDAAGCPHFPIVMFHPHDFGVLALEYVFSSKIILIEPSALYSKLGLCWYSGRDIVGVFEISKFRKVLRISELSFQM